MKTCCEIKEVLDFNFLDNFQPMMTSLGNIIRKIKKTVSLGCIHKNFSAAIIESEK